MARNKLTDVNDHLIAAMEELAEGGVKEKRMEELKQLSYVGKTLVESAKAEAIMVGNVAKLTKESNGQIVYRSNFITDGNENKPEQIQKP